MTGQSPETRATAYLNLEQPDVSEAPDVSLHSAEGQPPIAVVELGTGQHLSMHIPTAAQARALAAAFTKAAELLDAADADAEGGPS